MRAMEEWIVALLDARQHRDALAQLVLDVVLLQIPRLGEVHVAVHPLQAVLHSPAIIGDAG